jgi:hypothetical protein
MADDYQLSFTLPQIKALIRALEECGVDSESHTELEHFRSAHIVTAAKSAYVVLQAKRLQAKRDASSARSKRSGYLFGPERQ